MRRSTVFLLLLQGVAVLGSHDQKVLSDKKSPESINTGSNERSKSGWVVDDPPPPIRQPAADLVDDALVHLNKIPDAKHRRRNQAPGLVHQLIDLVYQLTFTWSVPASPQSSSKSPPTSTRGPLYDAVDLLQQAAQRNNSDALYLLADMNFYGNYSHPRDLGRAFSYYQQLASDHGNSTAQFMLGFYYSTGIGSVVPRNQAKAMLYYTFAAAKGDARADMAVGFRHHAAIGTPKNCELAVKHYKRVAEKAIDWYRAGPPMGMSWVHESWRIADDNGGAYGRGASAASSGLNAIKVNIHSDTNAAIDDVIEYLDLLSKKGDSKASLNLGRIYYEGQRGQERSMEDAKRYFFTVAKRYWKNDGRVLDNYKIGIEKTAAKAAAYIGRMYLRGEGLEQSYDKAKMWFERGRSLGDSSSMHGLAIMLMNGFGVKKNVALATELFRTAADKDYAPAQIELAVLYLDQGGAEDVRVANSYFELAARYGLIEAHYYLAELVFQGVGRDKNCGLATQYYKGVAEKAEPLVSSWGVANQAYEDGDYETALLHYLIMAEQGYEKAQNNVAHLLDPDQSRVSLTPSLAQSLRMPLLAGRPLSSSPLMEDPSMALVYWTRSSRQGNIDSLVKMGDYYFYGIGTESSLPRAVQCYTGAATYSQSAQALYNLGWMHENGIGLTQDYHLAKRYYDQALEVNEEAYLPVTLSLLKLRLKSAWNTFTHGPIHSIQDDPKPKKDWSLSEWISNFIKDGTDYYEDSLYDDIFDDTIGDREGGLDDDSGLELLFIFGISMALVGLLYYRQYRQNQERRQQDDQRRRPNGAGVPLAAAAAAPPAQPIRDNGLFPGGNDPDFANWAAGGIGH